MTPIRHFNTIQEAYIAKGMLADHGIRAEVTEEAIASIFPAPGSGSAAVTLYVPEDSVHRAEELLDKAGE